MLFIIFCSVLLLFFELLFNKIIHFCFLLQLRRLLSFFSVVFFLLGVFLLLFLFVFGLFLFSILRLLLLSLFSCLGLGLDDLHVLNEAHIVFIDCWSLLWIMLEHLLIPTLLFLILLLLIKYFRDRWHFIFLLLEGILHDILHIISVELELIDSITIFICILAIVNFLPYLLDFLI